MLLLLLQILCPKAGQGMNVSMADTFNLGWKLASVLRGQSDPSLLNTYSGERQAKAKELIDFDREMAQRFSAPAKDGDDADMFQRYFSKHARYTAGVETRYDPSMIIGTGTYQHLAKGFVIGTRFHSAPVIRLADAKPLHLGHVLAADGRWRLFLCAPDSDSSAIEDLAETLLNDPSSPINRYTPKGADIDSVIDIRAVFQTPHAQMTPTQLHPLLRPQKGRFGLTDCEKAFCPDFVNGDIFELRGIDRSQGAMIVVRPDQYIAQVLPLDGIDLLGKFFEKVMLPCENNIGHKFNQNRGV